MYRGIIKPDLFKLLESTSEGDNDVFLRRRKIKNKEWSAPKPLIFKKDEEDLCWIPQHLSPEYMSAEQKDYLKDYLTKVEGVHPSTILNFDT